ncbi:adenylate kinase [candidate division SR1 bacterium]|nr:adenylate kinase [candidate division SR1 bacterium]
MDIILSGIQASGKGTQSRLLLEHFGEKMKYCEMGGILRGLQTTDNPIGSYLKNLTESGQLVKDEIISGLWGVFMETVADDEMILGDGMLRQIGQTIQITEKMRDKDRLFKVIHLEIPDEEVIKRIQSRLLCKQCQRSFSILQEPTLKVGGKCPNCGGELYIRPDDADINAVRNRIQNFYKGTTPSLEWLAQQGILIRIDGMQDENKIFNQILSLISK